jgi:hypothetical protein
MRIYDDRYSRDRLRLDTALRFIQHEARTRTIRQWTGLSDDRIRKLYHSYLGGAAGAPRHRGRSPQQAAYFTRTRRLRGETACLTSLYLMLGVVPPAPVGDPRRVLPGVVRGRLLCQAYDVFQSVAPGSLISFEHAVYLAHALGRRDELRPARCIDCGAVVAADRCALRAPRCVACDAAAPPG